MTVSLSRMLGTLGVSHAFSTYDIFNLGWVIRTYPIIKSRHICTLLYFKADVF
jgi:hypothetical protein